MYVRTSYVRTHAIDYVISRVHMFTTLASAYACVHASVRARVRVRACACVRAPVGISGKWGQCTGYSVH